MNTWLGRPPQNMHKKAIIRWEGQDLENLDRNAPPSLNFEIFQATISLLCIFWSLNYVFANAIATNEY